MIKGKRSLKEGIRFILAHIDSPRLDLKLCPLYGDEQLAFCKTHYYGGIKKYQWTALPMTLYGVVVLQSGKRVAISAEDGDQDPVFMVTDLLPHLAKEQLEKKLKEAIEAEDLNLLVGSIPLGEEKEAKEKIKLNVLKILNAEHDLVEKDFIGMFTMCGMPPGWGMVWQWRNILVGGGKYSTNEAHAEYMAKMRKVFNEAKVPWQPSRTGKVDVGGGGTVAMFLAKYSMDILDAGVPLFNMHAPFEIASRADLYAAFLGI